MMFMAYRYLFKKLGNYNVTTKGFRVSIEIRSCCFCINPPSLKWPPMAFLSISCLGQYNICFMEYANAVVVSVLQYRNSIPSKISIFRWCRFLFCTIINSRWGIQYLLRAWLGIFYERILCCCYLAKMDTWKYCNVMQHYIKPICVVNMNIVWNTFFGM